LITTIEVISVRSVDEAAPRPFRMQQMDVEKIQEFRKCIECFLCQDVCHVLRDHNRKDGFFGPRHMVRIAALEMHPLDDLNRPKQLKGEAGGGFCNITKCCTEVCPEHIHITDNAIIPLKERVADDFFGPVRRRDRRLRSGQYRTCERTIYDSPCTRRTPTCLPRWRAVPAPISSSVRSVEGSAGRRTNTIETATRRRPSG
jgi:NAD-dependent dihydropyrimidine dehydrogenase PreA subunit